MEEDLISISHNTYHKKLQKLQRNKHEFDNKVTDVFVQKDRQMDFIYKWQKSDVFVFFIVESV